MRLDPYQCLVRVPCHGGWLTQTVQVFADSYWSAKVQLEAQYGRDNLISTPEKVR